MIKPENLRAIIIGLLSAEHFTAPGVRLTLAAGMETVPWEVFQGRLLPNTQTRDTRTFESWNVHVMTPEGPSPEPVVAVKADDTTAFVVRGVEAEVWEGHGESVIEGVRHRGWVRELVASIPLSHPDLECELTLALSRAFTGTALPLTPEESPHPLFSFGMLAYQPPGPFDARRLEFLVRSINDGQLPQVAAGLADALAPEEFLRLLKRLFLAVSLSPWTCFIPRLFSLIEMSHLSPDQQSSFHAWLLTLVCRHLTAYDLITFHHRGANYPDALLLDESLSRLIRLMRSLPEINGRQTRRALRQAWLIRRRYMGHVVPDTPTSPGEQARVFPGGQPRVPDEQLTDPRSRLRRLFTEPAGVPEDLLHNSVNDLEHPEECLELGAAVFLGRPLGAGKAAVEPDATPLLATLAFSRTIATARLHELRDAGLISAEKLEEIRPRLEIAGVSLSEIGPSPRLASVSLADAARVATDFVFLRTLQESVRRFKAPFDWSAMPPGAMTGWSVIAPHPSGGVMIHGPGIHLIPDYSAGYVSEAGAEYPAAGLLWGEILIPSHQRKLYCR
jgi:hypothetical protein